MECIPCILVYFLIVMALIFVYFRYFVLSDSGLSYSKSRGDAILNIIPLEDMLAVERVDETAFNMKFVRL